MRTFQNGNELQQIWKQPDNSSAQPHGSINLPGSHAHAQRWY